MIIININTLMTFIAIITLCILICYIFINNYYNNDHKNDYMKDKILINEEIKQLKEKIRLLNNQVNNVNIPPPPQPSIDYRL